jgi:hypothetical protein
MVAVHFKPVVGGEICWPLECPEVAEAVWKRAHLKLRRAALDATDAGVVKG